MASSASAFSAYVMWHLCDSQLTSHPWLIFLLFPSFCLQGPIISLNSSTTSCLSYRIPGNYMVSGIDSHTKKQGWRRSSQKLLVRWSPTPIKISLFTLKCPQFCCCCFVFWCSNVHQDWTKQSASWLRICVIFLQYTNKSLRMQVHIIRKDVILLS